MTALRTGALAALVLLAGCGGRAQLPPPEPIIQTVTVEVPVDNPECPRKVMATLGTSPDYPDDDSALAAAANLFERVKLLLAGRELREDRETALIGAIAECAE